VVPAFPLSLAVVGKIMEKFSFIGHFAIIILIIYYINIPLKLKIHLNIILK
jgi:hypothetical protein